DGAGPVELDREPPDPVRGIRGEGEVEPLPCPGRDREPLPGISPVAFAVFQSDDHFGIALGPQPQVTLVGFARDERHAPPVEPAVFDSELAVPALECDPLALLADERLAGVEG